MSAPAQQTASKPCTVVQDWAASGDASTDLASWIEAIPAGQARIASRTISADQLHAEALSSASRDAFFGAISDLPGGPCRVWSFLPRPTECDSDSLERYMRFNAGRTEAYRMLADRVHVVPAGTCVGHAGANLVVHALWVEGSFAAVENPRQRPAWLYSKRYGPVPPAFTRAARTGSLLLASGTASVVGESSMHAGLLDAQFDESVRNLAALAETGGGTGRWRSLQIYVRDAAHLARVRELASDRFGGEVERILHAPICRRELLVEIEGICDVVQP